MSPAPILLPATAQDVEGLLPFVAAFYSHFGYPFALSAKEEALRKLLAAPSLGRVFFIVNPEGEHVGYIILSFYFSLEYGGVTAFVDELWVDAGNRGLGIGTQALRQVLEVAESLGVTAIHLEAERTNTGAAALYERLGFKDYNRRLLTKLLGRGASDLGEA